MQGGAGKKFLGSLRDLQSQAKLGGGAGCGETSFVICFLHPGDLTLDDKEEEEVSLGAL